MATYLYAQTTSTIISVKQMLLPFPTDWFVLF